MALNDPLGDMIARIHNAQMRKKPKVSTPASRLRVSVLDVLKSEGLYPRLRLGRARRTAAASSRSSSNISTARR